MAKLTSYRSLRSETEYLKLLAANLVNRFGDSVDSIAFSWMMYQVTGNASLMALIVGLNYLPTVLLTPFAGVVVDRMRKKNVMVWMDLGRAVMVGLTVALLHFGLLTPGTLIFVTLMNSTLEALRSPAGSAIVPMLLPVEKYELGAGLTAGAGRAVELAGLALAGGIVAGLGVGGALLIDLATFVISAAIIACIRVQEAAAQQKQTVRGVWTGFRAGLRVVRETPILVSLGLLGMLINLSMVPLNVFGTPYVTDSLHGGAEMLSLMEIAMVAGMGLGSIAAPKITHLSGRAQMALFGSLVGVCVGALAFLPGVTGLAQAVLLAAVTGLMGVGVGLLSVVFSAAFMRLVPAEKMGTISGLLNAVLCLAMPVGSFVCSALAQVATIPQVLLASGVLAVVLFNAAMFIKNLKEL